jgi:RecA/RadA recombinase
MCVPINALTAAQTAASIYSTRQSAKVGGQQAGMFAEQAALDYEAVSSRGRQQRRQIKQQLGSRAQQSAKELGRINAVLADSNLVGGSAERLRREVLFNEATDVQTLQENAFQASEQVRRDFNAIRTDTRSKINGIARPSAAGSALSIFSSGLTNQGPSVGNLWDTATDFFGRKKTTAAGPELLNKD